MEKSELYSEMKKLVAKWRAFAELSKDDGDKEEALAIDGCADELQILIDTEKKYWDGCLPEEDYKTPI